LFQRKTADSSLVYFSLFSLLYAVRLIFHLGFLRSLLPASADFWKYSNLAINDFLDNFIVVPLTLFLTEVMKASWKTFLHWVLAFQIVFAAIRFSSKLFHKADHPVDFIYHIVIIAYCVLLFAYPFSFSRDRRMPREMKVIYAGLFVFGLFVARNNLAYLGVLSGRDVEAFGLLVLVGCLGYVAALRTYSNEERLLSIQKELEIARQIQSSILPRKVPHVADLDIAAQYVPMTAVAGDFYDFLVVDEKRVGILVADVTGHGVPAALIAAMLKTALAAQSTLAPDPAQVLAGLNRSLCGKFEEHFVTAGYLFLDAEKQILRYSGAGHPPLVLGAVNGKRVAFREIDSNGLLLGLVDSATYTSLELPFRPGDRCVLYTDGVLEAKNAAQEEFGSSRFLEFLEGQAHLAPAPLISAALAELTRWSGKRESAAREDDITLIAIDFVETISGGGARSR
ncbi:MAG TPA: PP2C family protein-serine/threonine phosphatase, partial [Candidatus Dormibacteraeota bacterium]|nr:PP2C family protein-serine/threonine phosphatase [Candidatus Dormibacteraeota bacterium]